jgi:hypothetical protein
MTLTKLKKTVVLVFDDEEFEQVCNAIQATISLNDLVNYIGSANANLLYSIEKSVIAQLASSK